MRTDEPDRSGPLITEDDTSPHPTITDGPRDFGDQPTARTTEDLVVPKIGLGTWQLDDDEARSMVAAAIELGYRHLDTAQMYGNEAAVGRGIADSGIDRSELFVTTKIANENHEPDELVRSIEESLGHLRTDHVDLLLIHWPVQWHRIGATLAALAQVHAAGLARHIGVSNFTIEQLDVARDHAPLEVLQAECHVFFQQAELRRWCREHDWIFTAYSPLAQGAVFDDDRIRALDGDPGQIAVAWLTSLDGVVTIPRTSSREHLAGNWRSHELALDRHRLEVIAGLDEGRRLVSPDFAPW